MSVVEERAGSLATPVVQARRARKQRPTWRDNWWRHLVAILAVAFALFPVAYIISGSINADDTLAAAKLIPRKVTFSNFTELFTNKKENARATPTTSSHYGRWYLNTLLVAGVTSILTVMLGAIAAYAFSRFRFKGRRMGLIALLLIQMFPALLAVVAIYLIVLHVGDVFPSIGLNRLAGLILVYLGGVMGINTWLMKGFLDSIPSELDESARVDGATPAQTFWGVILPLAAPVLAVIALLSFIGTINEFIIASVILQTSDKWTLPVGMYGYVNDQYAQHWGPFAAGVLLAAIPVVLVFMSLQRFIVHGLTQGSVKG
jgi:arabinogalactan oligomer/maltooligosaccharide transport system permease protein